jgi:hypothetical protein
MPAAQFLKFGLFMIKRFCFAIFCLIPIFSYSNELEIESKKFQIFQIQEETEIKLLNATHQYLDFINKIGAGEIFPYKEVAENLLEQNLRKVFNGNLYTATRDDFIADLLLINATQGCWSVHPVEIITSPQSNTIVLRLIIKMENADFFTAIVILRFDERYLITEINEVFNRMGNPYNFNAENK